MTDKTKKNLALLKTAESMKSMSHYLSTQMQSISTDYDREDYASISAPMTRVEQQICREFYLTVMDGIWEMDKTENGWLEARQQFDLVLETAEETLKQNQTMLNQGLESGEEKEIVLNVDGNLYQFAATELKNKSIGRIPFTDMPFRDQHTTTESRLHAIVHVFPALGLIAVIDLGSAAGIKMVERSNAEAPLTRSRASDRRPLVIGIDECAVFKLGQVYLTINPKKCIICEENYRNFVGACGHFICCQGCADQWRNQGIGQRCCPACNQTFFGPGAIQGAGAHVMTMQNRD